MIKLVLAVETTADAPEWLRILPLGRVELQDGRESFEVTPKALERLLAAYREGGVDLVVDYEHQSLTGGRAPAAGWVKDLEIREDGLWARVEWTAAARSHIVAREYRYFSPVLLLDQKTREPRKLLHLGLTNVPAIKDLTPLAARSLEEARAAQEARSKRYGIGVKEGGHVRKPAEWAEVPEEEFADPVNWRYPMPDADQARAAWSYWNQQKNQADYSEEERRKIAERIIRRAKSLGLQIQSEEDMKVMMEKLKQLLGMTGEAGEEELLALAGKRLLAFPVLVEIAEILGMTSEATPGEVKGAVLALKRGADRLQTVENELAGLMREMAQIKARKSVQEAMQAGRLQPSQEEWALKYAADDPEGFRVYVEKSPRIVPVGLELKVPRENSPGGGGLSAEELMVCKSLNLSPDAFKAERERLGYSQGKE
jgi:phage I-like protein